MRKRNDTVGRLEWRISPPQNLYYHRQTPMHKGNHSVFLGTFNGAPSAVSVSWKDGFQWVATAISGPDTGGFLTAVYN